MNILAPISLGELLDKISILKIKLVEITDSDKIKNIQTELNSLVEILNQNASGDELSGFINQLYEINYKIWHCEDRIRECERQKDFGQQFVTTAREIYKYNDQRSIVKRTVNIRKGSVIVEEKSYKDY
jgi:hypothetical protein